MLHLRRFGENRNGTTYRWNRQSRGTQATLNLDARRYVRQTLPVRPVHPSVFHVIDRLAVDEERRVALVKSAEADARVAVTTALLRSVHTGRAVHDFWEFHVAHLLCDFRRGDGRYRYRRFPCDRDVHDVGDDGRGAQAKGRGFKADASHVRFGSEGSGFVADEGDDDVAVSCSVQAKRAVGSGGDSAAAAFDHYSCSRKCTACRGICDFTCDLRKRNRCRCAENAHEGEVNKMSHSQIVNLMI